MIADTFMERRQLGKVLPLWVPSISLESPLTPIVEEIRQLCFDYAKRIVGRQSRTTHLPKQGPLKFGTGIRQIRAEDTCKLPSRCFRPAPHFPFRVSSSSSTYVHMRKYIYYACDIVENEVNMGRVNLVLSDDVERRLRLAVVNRYGGKKGDLSEAVEQAIRDWLTNRSGRNQSGGDKQ